MTTNITDTTGERGIVNAHPTGRLHQVMGFTFSPRWLQDPDRAIPALKETRSAGFGTIVGFVRHMHHTVTHDYVRQAVIRTVENCHKLGLRFALDTDWAHWAGEYVECRPEMAMWHTARGETTCLNGMFDLNMPYVIDIPMGQVAEITTVYGVTAEGERIRLEPGAVDYTCRSYNSQQPLPCYDDDRVYEYYRPGLASNYTLGVSGHVAPHFVKVIFYVSFQGCRYPDIAHPYYLEAQRGLLDSYAEAGLDGVGWDEPGKGGRFDSWKCGAGFFTLFGELHGYDLRERIIDLDEGESVTAIQTRRDYHHVLRETNYRAQKEFNDHARVLFGDDIFCGTHQTFSGLAIDVRCGCVDYFRLGEVLSHAFTDQGWDVGPFGVTFHNFALSESLRKELGKPRAYCDDWSRTPRHKWYDYFTRVKSLYQVDWFAIFIGESNERHSLFPDDPYWPDMARNAKALNRLAEYLGDDCECVSETAVWYGWESLVSHSEHAYLIRLCQTFFHNIAQAALDSGRFFNYVSDRALGGARIEEGQLVINGRVYRRLVMPYATILRPEVWKVIGEAAAASVPVVFIGPPPWRTTEGEELGEAFSSLVGVQLTSFLDYHAWYSAHKPCPGANDYEPARVDFSYPATPETGTRATRDVEGDLVSVENPANQAAWLVGVDPGPLAVPLLGEPPWDGLALIHKGRAHLRIFRANKGKDHVVLLASPMAEQLDEVLTLGDLSLPVTEGTWAAIRIANGKLEAPFIVNQRQDTP